MIWRQGLDSVNSRGLSPAEPEAQKQAEYTLEDFRRNMVGRLMLLGVRDFDQQHGRLVDYIVDLYATVALFKKGIPTPEQVNDLTGLLDALTEYTLTHFRNEEVFMESIGYPQLEQHRKAHQLFIKKFTEIRRKIDGGAVPYVVDLFFLTFGWLFEHINRVDSAYRDYVLQRDAL
ncbi:MAG: bacteriohemerythrin [Magnetococcus sp. WYHC-3]